VRFECLAARQDRVAPVVKIMKYMMRFEGHLTAYLMLRSSSHVAPRRLPTASGHAFSPLQLPPPPAKERYGEMVVKNLTNVSDIAGVKTSATLLSVRRYQLGWYERRGYVRQQCQCQPLEDSHQ
jgi:hypothetical protein